MPWLQLETVTGHANPAPIETLLGELGAVAITLRDAGDTPLLEPAPGATPLWPASVITALFPADTDAVALRATLAAALPELEIALTTLQDRDWQAEWQASLRPQEFGDGLWLLPLDAPPPANAAACVRLEPGLAFGTGEHPTTALCLSWLSQLELHGLAVLDYGCGSGVLAIAALALGAQCATAVDIDPQALEATRANADNNQCGTQLSVALPRDLENAAQYDVLIANILSGTLIELAPQLARRLRPGAPLALTGILAGQARAVVAAWAEWAALEVRAQQDEWVLLSGARHRT